MLYIGNNCVATRMYEKTNTKFNHPLCWGRVTYIDFKKLITQWDDINFNIIDISRINDSHLLIDKKIDFYFQHYKYNEKYDTPTKIDIDIYYNQIYSYIFNKYFERLNRMNKSDKITYILHQQALVNTYQITDSNCLDFINTETKYQKVLVTSNKRFLEYNTYGMWVIFDDKNRTTGDIANLIIESILK